VKKEGEQMRVIPWASGPGEILQHGLQLLREEGDANRRLAMISIDNAVELMVETYLGLPKRVTGLSITRKEIQEIMTFPALLHALEKYAPQLLDGVDLGVIEWYHDLRNKLYHRGNGLTVKRDIVEIYAELASVFFKNLFGQSLINDPSRKTELLGEFLSAWAEVERGLRLLIEREMEKSVKRETRPVSFLEGVRIAHKNGVLSQSELQEIEELRTIRNLAAHGQPGWEGMINKNMIERMQGWAKRLPTLS
jgi:hypothetical protein